MSLSDKHQAFVQAYCNNGYNATKAYKTTYPDCKSGHRQAGNRLLTNGDIRKAISAYKAQSAEKADIDRKYVVDKLVTIANSKTSSSRDVISALSLASDVCGFKRDTAPNAERETARAQRMSDEERELALALAKLRTDAEAAEKGSDKPVRTIKLNAG